MKYLGINKVKIAKETGLGYTHVRDYTVPKEFSQWMKFTLWVFDEMLKDVTSLDEKISYKAKEVAKLKREVKGLKKEIGELKGKEVTHYKDTRISVMGTISIDRGKPEPIEILSAPFPTYEPKTKDDE